MTDGRRLADTGWVWDGQAINGQWSLSIFGAGEGTRWFGLRRCCHMFHRNNALAMEKLADLDEVVCEISKWDNERVEHPDYPGLGAPLRMVHDGQMARKIAEADKVGRLSLAYPNVTAVYDDDLLGKIKNEKITPREYARVREAARKHNPDLKLWAVVYASELEPASWDGFQDCIDVVSLWVWDSAGVFELDATVETCRAIFPGKPIILGCYLRDFTILEGMPMDRLEFQWNKVLEYTRNGVIAGYSILGGFLIDLHEEQARWVRDFIAAN
ncbi:MAG: hypothetical protein HN742_09790 [Lentisphaerae bacterium]|jgi:hypothetical protein|nr:hypothetical protein [Lentisphaerota bacterium]MBT4823141.1 hypothetical protein [Lentisphaerota bacterium]MBT5610471.1 hypothetical protein [Lentisphaerota bacterium]MBT7061062.1 hypothetical protein [Lentisphaerota bacterium]MBT7842153.1 hypothetical protein [Lentisphaerota bacterium]